MSAVHGLRGYWWRQGRLMAWQKIPLLVIRRQWHWELELGAWPFHNAGYIVYRCGELVEGSSDVELPTKCIWKSRGGKSQRGEVKKWEDQRRERVGSKQMQVREKVGKSRFTVFLPMIWGSGGSKSNLAKAAGAEPAGQMRDEKLHAVVARGTFVSKKGKNTLRSDHSWMLRCWKSARPCGAKHVSKSKCTKHTILGPLLEVEMSKKCTLLWCEAHFQVKMYAAVAWNRFPSQKCKKLIVLSLSWR